MPNRTIKTEQDCKDFLTGLKLMGTGGGGGVEAGMEMLAQGLAEGLVLSWVDAANIPEDTFSCTTYGTGSISNEVPETLEQVEELGRKLGIPVRYGHDTTDAAVRELAAYAGVKIGALVSVELGASSVPQPLVTAARLGIPLVDGDYSGRAVPEDMQMTTFLKGVKTHPAAIVDWWGNVLILKEAASTEMGERIGKMLSMASHGLVFYACMLLTAKDTRETIVPGTLTLSLDLGRAVRQAREAGRSPTKEIARMLEGWELFSGVVTAKETEDKDGVAVGMTHLEGRGDWDGHKLDIWFLNENHVSWLDEKPYVFSPDLIILADPLTGEGYTNNQIKAGYPMTVLGARCYPAFRSEMGLKYFGPHYWGFNFDYVPIETFMDSRKR